MMDVFAFISAYPYPIGTQVNSVSCTFTTYAQNHQWRDFFVDGSIFHSADQLLFMLYVGSRAASEHSPSILRDVIGSPDFTVSTFEHGDPQDVEKTREKNYDFFLRHLPVVAPSHIVPAHLRLPRASHPDREAQMILRSSFTPHMARAFVASWEPLDPHSAPSASRPACAVAPGSCRAPQTHGLQILGGGFEVCSAHSARRAHVSEPGQTARGGTHRLHRHRGCGACPHARRLFRSTFPGWRPGPAANGGFHPLPSVR